MADVHNLLRVRDLLPMQPGRPAQWIISDEPPRRRRGLTHRPSRLRFLHAIFHIELSAVDLAVLACLRALDFSSTASPGPTAPPEFHADFLAIARDEAEHARLLGDYLTANAFPPGSDPVHHRLWDSALLAADLGEHLVIVPRFLEARGLDVTAELLPRMLAIDADAHAVLSRIYHDEIGHVGVGTRWQRWWCDAHEVDPAAHFEATLRRHFPDQVPGPFALDHAGRTAAGFCASELTLMTPAPRPSAH